MFVLVHRGLTSYILCQSFKTAFEIELVDQTGVEPVSAMQHLHNLHKISRNLSAHIEERLATT